MNENIYSLPWGKDCKIIHSDPVGLIVIDKAAGILSHPNKKNHQGNPKKQFSLLNLDYNQTDESYLTVNGNKLFLLHRLDSPTSGLIMVATSKTLAIAMKNLFRKNMIHKTYHAVIAQKQRLQVGNWIDSLTEIKNKGNIRMARGKGVPAKTFCKLEKYLGGKYKLALLKLCPETGRTHQIRVQAASRKMPIIGDNSYGDFAINRQIKKEIKISRMLLHASNIEFQLGTKTYKFKSPLPEPFGKLTNQS
ncbi:MAG: RluA family pseudouridine synthase [Opitutales bacterium]|nr:RluA family pseudouridine synthase [Opitutales bacterium]